VLPVSVIFSEPVNEYLVQAEVEKQIRRLANMNRERPIAIERAVFNTSKFALFIKVYFKCEEDFSSSEFVYAQRE
jgi:hypothetical protein